MGVGDSLEASFTLLGQIPAGTWRIVGDALVPDPVDVTFDLIWRSPAGDTTLVTFQHHFDPPASRFDAVPYEASAEGVAAAAAAGDQLVLRFSAANGAYFPNGDGELVNGRIPFVELP